MDINYNIYETLSASSSNIVKATTQLCKIINRMLMAGWKPVGGVSIYVENVHFNTATGEYSNKYTISQAMLRDK